MREVAVIGVGQSKFGKLPELSIIDLGKEAVTAAIKDGGILPSKIEVAYAASIYGAGSTTAQAILVQVGVSDIEMLNVQNACAGGATAVRGVWKEIADGRYDIGIAIGVESMTTSPIAGKMIPPAKTDLYGQLGMTMPGIFALRARRQMEEYGATVEDFAQVSVKNHHHGCLNPHAQYQKELTIDEIINSRMICDPITLLQCCPNTDGAAAVILCATSIAKQYTNHPIKIIGSALHSGGFAFHQKDITVSPLGTKTAAMAYEMAGCGPEDIDVIELHDAFAPEELMRYEDLGICKRGDSIKMLRDGETQLGGRVPVNPSGGLLSLGHPLSASGVRVVAEIALQLRNEAGKRQVQNAKIGLAHMLGGSVAGLESGACGIHILSR